jgi:hypothetical protein
VSVELGFSFLDLGVGHHDLAIGIAKSWWPTPKSRNENPNSTDQESSRLRIFPVAVIGRLSTISTTRGYL